MSWLSWFGFKPLRTAPERIPTDEVVQCNVFDDTRFFRRSRQMGTFQFEEVLDPEILNNTLCELFQMDGWRKLGGRLRLGEDGKCEIHVPCPFTDNRRPVYFTQERFDISLSEHPEASKLPKPGAHLAFFPSACNYQSLGVGPGAPRTFEDYVCSDSPQFSLHVVQFTDATLVSLGFPHMSTDLGGLVAIMHAWQLILAGKSEEVPPFAGFNEDGMAPIYQEPGQEPHKIAHKCLGGWRLAVWGIRFLLESWLEPRECRMVFLPKKIMDRVVQAARENIQLETSTSTAFISEGDILTAVYTQLVAESISKRSITVTQAVDPRRRCTSLLRQDAAYVQNCPTAAFYFTSKEEALEKPLGQVALICRQAIAEQLTEDQMKSTAYSAYLDVLKHGRPTVFGSMDTVLIVNSNWSSAGLYKNMDFSSAIAKTSPISKKREGYKPGHPVFLHAGPLKPSSFSPYVCTVVGRDPAGNVWMMMTLPPTTWLSLPKWFGRFED